MKKISIIILSIFALFVFCSKGKNESRSIVEIQKKEGFPVKVEKLQKKAFYKEFYYSGFLKGIKQSEIKTTLIIDEISKVHVKVGDRVKKDQVVIEMDSTNPLAKYNQAKQAYLLYQKTFERIKHVYEVGGVSKQKFDEVKAKYLASKADFISSKNALKLKSPISGIVTEVNIHEGEMPTPGIALVKVADIDSVLLIINVSTDDIKYFNVGDSSFITYNNNVYTGIVNKVSLSANQLSRQFTVEILIPNKDKTLNPGIYIDANIKAKVSDSTYVVKRSAVFYDDDDNPYIFYIKNNRAFKKYIKTGIFSSNLVQIFSDLTSGTDIVVYGGNLLADSVKVKVINK